MGCGNPGLERLRCFVLVSRLGALYPGDRFAPTHVPQARATSFCYQPYCRLISRSRASRSLGNLGSCDGAPFPGRLPSDGLAGAGRGSSSMAAAFAASRSASFGFFSRRCASTLAPAFFDVIRGVAVLPAVQPHLVSGEQHQAVRRHHHRLAVLRDRNGHLRLNERKIDVLQLLRHRRLGPRDACRFVVAVAAVESLFELRQLLFERQHLGRLLRPGRRLVLAAFELGIFHEQLFEQLGGLRLRQAERFHPLHERALTNGLGHRLGRLELLL